MSIFSVGAGGVEKFSIDQSLRFNDADSACLSKAFGAAGNNKIYTISLWVKRSRLSSYQSICSTYTGSTHNLELVFDNTYGGGGDRIDFYYHNGTSFVWGLSTIQEFRDPSAWYHFVIIYDSTGATQSDYVRMYVNGARITALAGSQGNAIILPAQNVSGEMLDNKTLKFGCKNVAAYFGGYMAELFVLDGQAQEPSTFGEADALTGQWIPKDSTDITDVVTFGTNGFYLDFADSADLGNDVSGQGNDFTVSNLVASDQVPDSPTQNFATMNMTDVIGTNGNNLSNGNLELVGGALPSKIFASTIAPASGKWYAEFYQVSNDYTLLGVADAAIWKTLHNTGGIRGSGAITWDAGGSRYFINSTTQTNSVGGSADDILQIAFDADTRKVWFGINGTWNGSGDPAAGTNEIGTVAGTGALTMFMRPESTTQIVNFGQDPTFAAAKTAPSPANSDASGLGSFGLSVPSGFKALIVNNLVEPSIAAPGEHMNTVLYTGTGSIQSITGVGFQPDFVWIKKRNAIQSNGVFDSVRGVYKVIGTDHTNAEGTNTNMLTAFGSDGFTLGTDAELNSNTNTFASWNWKGSDTPSKTFAVTVTNPGSGNRYTLDGKVSGTNAMPITIEEGGTYTFDQSDNTNSGHPLRFSTTSDGTHGGGSEYTTGVTVSGTPGSAGAKTVITVAASAATLYFYCTAHSGMGAQASTPGSGGGVSDLSGTIASVVNANTTSGFSIVSYTGTGANATIGHGLSSAPNLVIYKNLSDGGSSGATNANWIVGSTAMGVDDFFLLNEDDAATTDSGYFDSTRPSSSVLTVGAYNSNNGSGDALIAYCFHSVAGYSKVGTYVGNASADGPFTYIDFKPRWILIKSSTAASTNWHLYDNKRLGYNVDNNMLRPNLDAAEQTDDDIDLLSNGFKIRRVTSALNNSGATYVYLAIAESPFKTSNAR